MNLSYAPMYEMYGPVYAGPGASKYPEPIEKRRLTAFHKEAINRAKKYAMEQSIRTVLLKQTKQHEVQQLINVKRTQAMVLLSRIYVGSINYDVKEDTIRAAFGCFGPVKSVSLSYDPITQKHMGYAFLEFEYPEGAQLSLSQTSGITISGRQCKVGRPTNMPHSGPLVDELYAEAFKAPRIYVANVHANLTSEDLRQVFEAFGEIESCLLQPDLSRPGKHRGFGFVEYKNLQAAIEAIGAMNMFDLGGQMLRVSRAITPGNLVLPVGSSMMSSQMPAAAAVAAASITAQVQVLEVKHAARITDQSEEEHVEMEHGGDNESAKSSSSRKRKRKKFSEAKVATEEFGVPTLVIPEVLKESASSDNVNAAGKLSSSSPTTESTHQPVGPPPDPEPVVQVKDEATAVQVGAASGGGVADDDAGDGDDDESDTMKIRGREARSQMMQKLLMARALPQRVMLLRNLVGREEVDEELEEEVCGECGKFGEVSEVKIFVQDNDNDDDDEDCVRVFIVFARPESVSEAVKAMHNRFFGGRIIQASSYEQELYDMGDYTA